MITTTEHIESKEGCCICGFKFEPPANNLRCNLTSYPALFGGRICSDCENKFKRNKIPSSGQTEVERDYKAFLDGKRNYPIRVQITCADGCEINSPISDKAAKSFLVS